MGLYFLKKNVVRLLQNTKVAYRGNTRIYLMVTSSIAIICASSISSYPNKNKALISQSQIQMRLLTTYTTRNRIRSLLSYPMPMLTLPTLVFHSIFTLPRSRDVDDPDNTCFHTRYAFILICHLFC